jgi:exopolysaccharide biosynthesis polyprenyl glycosylphosphotransferase
VPISKAAPSEPEAPERRRQSPSPPTDRSSRDARSSRLYVLSRGPLFGLVRRIVGVCLLVVLDIAGLALGLYVALVLRQVVYGESDILWNLLWREGPQEWLPFLAPITILVFLQAGLYAPRERRAGAGRVVASLILVALIVLAFGIGTNYDFTTTGLIPTAVVTCAIAIALLRAAYESISLELLRVAGVRRRVVLVGDGERLAQLHRTLAASRSGLVYEFVGSVSKGDVGLPSLGESADDLPDVLAAMRPDEIILSEAGLDEATVLDIVDRAHRAGVRVRLAPNTTELLVHEGEYVPGQGAPLFELRPPVLTGAEWALKRVFDVVISALIVLIGLPLWLLVALAIRLDTRGPIFYVDRRIGLGEREFGMFKLRTMVADAAERQPELERENEASGALFKIRDDPRVTRVGRVLRRLSLDELPQVLNVLRGEMSLVGPRPLPLRDYALLEDWHRTRYNVLPGMTGLWQISGRSGLSFDDLVRLDFTYLENWSIWLDITILAKTIPAVLTRKGAY